MKMRWVSTLLVLISFGLFSCSSQKIPLEDSIVHTKLAGNKYFLKLENSQSYSFEEKCRHLYLRAAQLTVQGGFNYFLVLDDGVEQVIYQDQFYFDEGYSKEPPTKPEFRYYTKNNPKMNIQCFNERPLRDDLWAISTGDFVHADSYLQNNEN